MIFFVFVAGTIYVASYVPFEDSAKDNTERFYEVTDENYKGFKWENTFASGLVDTLRDHSGNPVAETIGKMLNNQHAMYEYHSKLKATHPWQSSWYEWPTMIRPMYYYCQTLRDGMKEGISAFGNPLVWWAGIPALILILLPFGRRRSNRLGSKTSQWLQSIGCEFFAFLVLWRLVVKQSSSDGSGNLWTLYGPFFIVLGVVALYIAYQLVTRGDKKALFMVFAYAVQLLPWILVPRSTFAEFVMLFDDGDNFFVCNRGIIVNLEHIRDMNGNQFVLDNGERISISRSLVKSAKSTFGEYIFGRRDLH